MTCVRVFYSNDLENCSRTRSRNGNDGVTILELETCLPGEVTSTIRRIPDVIRIFYVVAADLLRAYARVLVAKLSFERPRPSGLQCENKHNKVTVSSRHSIASRLRINP